MGSIFRNQIARIVNKYLLHNFEILYILVWIKIKLFQAFQQIFILFVYEKFHVILKHFIIRNKFSKFQTCLRIVYKIQTSFDSNYRNSFRGRVFEWRFSWNFKIHYWKSVRKLPSQKFVMPILEIYDFFYPSNESSRRLIKFRQKIRLKLIFVQLINQLTPI